ncbi:hydroxymethylglutaryl-CoA synthase [Nevskia sp.]|uniref:hydroxymethylglutaryl-CoA synthase n=1 Tax=Nevskia sp. TaxID=1929292 RepID=UPI0025F562D4|nr:hydroxymethylglutaryl-CoA synthase [Nevskia sp.]
MSKAEFGISAFAAYVPPYRVDLREWCDWTGNSWDKTRAVIGESFRVPGVEEDVYTMAANSVLALIERNAVDPTKIGYLALGTESSVDNATGAVIVRGLVDRALAAKGRPRIARDCEVPEFKQACLAGIYGIKGAIRYLSHDGYDRQAIVVAADIAEYERGSSGEPTQGAGAVAMLLERDPKIVALDLRNAGSASTFRGLDFRKPFQRYAGQTTSVSGRLSDFPVFNGKYSTACYVDETMAALEQLLTKHGGARGRYFRELEAVFMHRPYHKMPVTAWAMGYLFALGADGALGADELNDYCARAGVDPTALAAEMATVTTRAFEPDFDGSVAEPYPLTAALMKAFRETPTYKSVVDDKMRLGAKPMMAMGNLYSAALPGWLAAGLEEAANSGRDLAGREILLIGYGSGDASEAIPARVVPGWQGAAKRIHLAAALDGAVALSQPQYAALHEGRPAPDLALACTGIRIERIGERRSGPLQDYGIAYYALPI